jgi:hypothetical protein
MMEKIKKTSDTIYVRIDPDDKGWLQKYVEGHPDLSEKAVIAGLIKYFMRLPSDAERNAILRDPESLRSSVGAVIELMGWGDHAFSRGNWEWALEAYSVLLRRHSEGAPGIKRFAYYKRGYCWLDVAIRLREEALWSIAPPSRGVKSDDVPEDVHSDELWKEHYLAADRAIDVSIRNNKKFEEWGGKHPIVHYSIACGWALRAKYTVERALPRGDRLLIDLATAIHPKGDVIPLKRPPDDTAWKNIADGWREKVARSARKRLEGEAEGYARAAMTALKDILREGVAPRPQEASGAFVPNVDVGYFVRYAQDDSDLLFLKYDRSTKGDYRKWEEMGGREKAKSWLKSKSWLETFDRLWESHREESRELGETD